MSRKPRTPAWAFAAALCALALLGCGFVQGDAARHDPGIPGKVMGVVAEPGDGEVTISWTQSSVATSYNVYCISDLTASVVTKENGAKTQSVVGKYATTIDGLDNKIQYHFIVTAQNRDGEGPPSDQVSATPYPISPEDLAGTWYFHALVTGAGARWERGVLTVGLVDGTPIGTLSSYEVSNASGGGDPRDPPPVFSLTVNAKGDVTQTGEDEWGAFHGTLGKRKMMIVATYSPGAGSQALIIFQRKRDTSDYSICDIGGTGSGQNPCNLELQGNGPTRFAYHQLSSGSSTEWEYSNCKVGQHGNIWQEEYKDVIYWDYSTPTYKVAPGYEYLSKVTSMDIDQDGLLSEYDNYGDHEVVFTGRMTADKSMVVGVSTRKDASGAFSQYFLRIMELSFLPADQGLPQPTLSDLVGDYSFHELSSASWDRGVVSIDATGATAFPQYTDSAGDTSSSDRFTLAYYPDNGSKQYRDFANFATAPVSGTPHYCYDSHGQGGGAGYCIESNPPDGLTPYHMYYDFWSYGRTDAPLLLPISPNYYNEHGSLSYLTDVFVLTRTTASGNSLLVGIR